MYAKMNYQSEKHDQFLLEKLHWESTSFFFKWVGIFLLLVLLRVSLLAGESNRTGTVLVQYRAQGYSLLAGHMAGTTALITVKTLELPLPLVMNVQQWIASCKYIRSAVVFWECVFRKHKKMYLYYCKKNQHNWRSVVDWVTLHFEDVASPI